MDSDDLTIFFKALDFAAKKHKDQRRKDKGETPYINHPIAVANTLVETGKVTDVNTIAAALLHDTIEDTNTNPDEIEEEFGKKILALVLETTDKKWQPKPVRKFLQIKNASKKSNAAKQIKLADKICNVQDVLKNPPVKWSNRQQRDYLIWAEMVIKGLRGVNPDLEKMFDELILKGKQKFGR
ncbi:MAG: bifunctional (p)ppGpp synthetase/guanosine-3',5'-bis(diphosphate) 3'-pyrophosphohydrolase [Bacteroidales bacterium]|nr:bifunctional (p)ppGpp synthetase/guanosine-3',5'-bis(diphosphate) 3'-pyrophosphohydrolase [Bacteroidales bacterium]